MSATDAGPICALDFRYGRDEVRGLFSRRARLARVLRVEAALAGSEADEGLIPKDAADTIADAAGSGRVTVERVDALEKELQHDLMAITRALAEQCGAAGAWVHFGATSNDITDTALGLELQSAITILRRDLTDLSRVLVEQAKRHRATAEVGRTHGQHAVPMSFGYKLAVAAAEVLRHRDRLDEMTPRIAVGKMAGAVGTGAGLGPKSARVEARTMERLGLTTDDAPTQVVGRDRIAELTNLLALIAGTAERLATEVRNLQRTEIGEVAEWFDEAHQVGSSTMAQKRNPVVSETVTSLARLVRAFALPPLENIALWHERDLTNSANERIVIPHAIVLTDDLLVRLTGVYAKLVVDPERMSANLASSGGAIMTESLMLGLTRKGLARAEAHELLRKLTAGSLSGPTLRERARADPGITRWLPGDEIERLLDPGAYVEAAAEKTDRLVRRLEHALAA